MSERNVGAVVVKDFGRLIGILSERDMLRAMAARVHTSEARVRQWMTPDPITAPPDMSLDDAARVMLDNGFRHLPVVDGSKCSGSSACAACSGATPTGSRSGLGRHAQAETTPLTRADAAALTLTARLRSCARSFAFERICCAVCCFAVSSLSSVSRTPRDASSRRSNRARRGT